MGPEVETPNPLEDLLPSEDLAWIAQKQFEQTELRPRQVYGPTTAPHLPGARVQHEISVRQDRVVGQVKVWLGKAYGRGRGATAVIPNPQHRAANPLQASTKNVEAHEIPIPVPT